eukprot:SAG22_NODE_21898_length_253_cov_0.655844_1_plen_49_part_01
MADCGLFCRRLWPPALSEEAEAGAAPPPALLADLLRDVCTLGLGPADCG